MSPWLAAVCAVAGLLVVHLLVLYRWIGWLPFAVYDLHRKERDKDHAEALAALHDAATAKARSLVTGIESYHERLAADLRSQAIDAQLRARVLERRSEEAGLSLEVASNLVTQLRELLEHHTPSQRRLSPAPAQVAAGLHRPTLLEIRQPPQEAGDRPSEEDLTQVIERSPKSGGAA